MSFTLTQLEAAAAHAAGRATFDTGNSTSFCVVQALGEFNNFAWSWRHKTTTLGFTSGQNYVALPTDFCQLVTLRGGTSTNSVMLPRTVSQVLDLRANSVTGTVGDAVFYAVDTTGQATGTNASTFKLQVYPTPDATTSDALQIQYLREITVPSAGSNVADIPNHLSAVLLTLVRGWAEMTEKNELGANWEVGHRMLAEAQARDGMLQPQFGPIRGLTDVMRPDDGRWFYDNPIVTVT
ncbi:MAG TPA: hypothetical protein VEA69_16715 [Tepidisphaeraceae bacterium]|nr:hypothetical protein [Tepidisphaeraceae bacterium]